MNPRNMVEEKYEIKPRKLFCDHPISLVPIDAGGLESPRAWRAMDSTKIAYPDHLHIGTIQSSMMLHTMKLNLHPFLAVALLIIIGIGSGKAQSLSRATLADIQISEVRFQSAKLHDVIEFLSRVSREVDPEGIGVNMVFMGQAPQPRDRDRAPADPIPPITMELRNVSFLRVLDLLTELTDLTYRIDRNIIFFQRQGHAPLETRFYSVDTILFDQRMRATTKR